MQEKRSKPTPVRYEKHGALLCAVRRDRLPASQRLKK